MLIYKVYVVIVVKLHTLLILVVNKTQTIYMLILICIVIIMAQLHQRSIMAIGTSYGISLPKPWLDYYEVKVGDKVEIITEGRVARIKLIPNDRNKDFDGSDKDE